MDDIILDPIVTRRNSPLVQVTKSLAGNDSLKIKAGNNLSVPNMFTLHSARIKLTTDATVANRTVVCRYTVNNEIINSIKSAALAASSTEYTEYVLNSLYANVSHYGANYITLNEWSLLIGGLTDHLEFLVTNGVSGDLLTLYLVFRWRNWDLGMMQPKPQKDSR